MTFEDLTAKLQSLADKNSTWQKLTPKEKLPYLESIKEEWIKVGPKGMETMLGQGAADMKGVIGIERDLVCSEESMIGALFIGYLDALLKSYNVLAGNDEGTDLKSFSKRTVRNQVVANVFPLMQADKEGPTGNFVGELWFQGGVKSEDVLPLQNKNLEDRKDGVLCILGAGNYTMLAVCDILHGLFVRNHVVFCKLHPLRSFLEAFMRVVLAKLYDDGFLDSEPDVSLERTQALVYSNLVTSVHMTGGKATHDAIVWGPPDQQEKNKANTTPVLKVPMTSELGAASPCIITPAVYTQEELEHQAKTIISGKWCNGSASCNAPQNIIMSKDWQQRDAFIAALEAAWMQAPPIATYYPGAADRWEKFAKQYDGATKLVHSQRPMDGDEKKQDGHNIDTTHLPLLLVSLAVDMSTPEGQAKAQKEYAFQNEAFTPVLALVTLEGSNTNFLPNATKLSNQFMFGSLSCSLVVPNSAEGSPEVEQAIADLKYGAIAVNAWAAACFSTWPLCWGGVHGEKLEAVESGLGNVCNAMFFGQVEKSVLRTPCVHPMHLDFCKSTEELIGYNRFVSNLVMGRDPCTGEPVAATN